MGSSQHRQAWDENCQQAAEHLRKAAEAFADKVLGGEAGGHLRDAARSALKAARAALDRVEERMDKRSGGSTSGDAAPKA